jgi:hypothetical protein
MGLVLAIRTASPVRDLGLVDLIAVVVVCREAGRFADGAIDVHYAATDSTDQMVMVVTHTIFEARRRSRGLNAPDQPRGDEHAERVVYRLKRNGADLGAHGVGNSVGGDVRLARYRPQNRQPLSCYLNAALSKEI